MVVAGLHEVTAWRNKPDVHQMTGRRNVSKDGAKDVGISKWRVASPL